MKIRVTKASDFNYEKTVVMDSMQELIDFVKEFGSIIVEEDDVYHKYDLSIMIYDDYVE